MITTSSSRVSARRSLPAGRWFAEIGWRYLVGVAALVFAAIPILYVLSASLNPLGSVASTDLVPRQLSLINYETLLSGQKGPFLRWYLNTVIVCIVVAATQVFLSLLARSEEHTSELQSRGHRVCRLLRQQNKSA